MNRYASKDYYSELFLKRASWPGYLNLKDNAASPKKGTDTALHLFSCIAS